MPTIQLTFLMDLGRGVSNNGIIGLYDNDDTEIEYTDVTDEQIVPKSIKKGKSSTTQFIDTFDMICQAEVDPVNPNYYLKINTIDSTRIEKTINVYQDKLEQL